MGSQRQIESSLKYEIQTSASLLSIATLLPLGEYLEIYTLSRLIVAVAGRKKICINGENSTVSASQLQFFRSIYHRAACNCTYSN